MISFSAISIPLESSKHCTLNRLADLFIPTPTQLLWEPFDYRAKTIHSHFHQVLSIASYAFIQLNELVRRGENENAEASKR